MSHDYNAPLTHTQELASLSQLVRAANLSFAPSQQQGGLNQGPFNRRGQGQHPFHDGTLDDMQVCVCMYM
jgi:hypothetical protein